MFAFLVFVLQGPTNSGKTYHAIERLKRAERSVRNLFLLFRMNESKNVCIYRYNYHKNNDKYVASALHFPSLWHLFFLFEMGFVSAWTCCIICRNALLAACTAAHYVCWQPKSLINC